MGLGAMKRAKQPAEWQGTIESLTRAKDADQPLDVDLWQWICAATMMIDQRLTSASFWTNIELLSCFGLSGVGAINCFRQ